MISIPENHLKELLWMARRYADGRRTFSPSVFNEAYQYLATEEPEFLNQHDKPDHIVKFWPYAQDGMYSEETGEFDARPKEVRERQVPNTQ